MATPADFSLAPPALAAVVVIPTYNERENIESILDRVLSIGGVDVLVVDDSSPDGTASIAAAHPESGRRVHVLVRPAKEGIGPAYRAGFAWALDRGYGRIVQMDADLSHPPDRIPALLAALEHDDIAVGSRYVEGGAVSNWPLRRRAISWAGNQYVRRVLGLSVRDATAGFKAFRRGALTAIDAVGSQSDGYSFQIENTWRAERRGLSVVEVPITFADRTSGRSKMSGAIVLEAVLRVLRWRAEGAEDGWTWQMPSVGRAAWLVAGLAVLAWLPFVRGPASPDEGGYLAVAMQWAPGGTSLYGDYWVDRPPLLIAVHAVAGVLGGVVPLRLLGMAAVVASVLLTARLVRLATGVRATQPATAWSAAPLVVAGTFLATPIFGTTQVDGELLSVPFVLAGIVAALHAIHEVDDRRARWWGVAAGAAAVAAAMVKQNAVDVFVVAAVVVVSGLGPERRPLARRFAGTFAAGAVVSAAGLLSIAAARGTSPSGLWDAVVSFRFEAASVIARSATSATSDRLVLLVESVLVSMAPFVAAVMAARLRRPAIERSGTSWAVDLRWPAVALLAWEVVSIAGGGSYWLHYLLVLVPGLITLAVAAAQRPPITSRLLVGSLALAVSSAAVAVVVAVAQPRDSTDLAVASYLREHAAPGDGAVVAFGHPDILWDSGLRSPYDELWSLPVKVRDPQLTAFGAVLASESAPTWVVVDGTSLGTWGVDATQADQTLSTRYNVVAEIGGYYIWRRN